MANRIGAFSTFAGLAPPWSLPNLDANFTAITTAFNDASLGYVNYIGTDSGSANNYNVTCVFGSPLANAAGMRIVFNPAHSNTGPSTITVTGLVSSVSILRPDGAALMAGDIVVGVNISLVSNGTAFQIEALPWLPFYNNLGSVATNQNLNVQNASCITVSAVFTNAAGFQLSLANVSQGAPIFIYVGNSSGATASFFVTATIAGGTSITPLTVARTGGANLNLSTGAPLAANHALMVSGTISYAVGGLFIGVLT